jgi:hypothetical protein
MFRIRSLNVCGHALPNVSRMQQLLEKISGNEGKISRVVAYDKPHSWIRRIRRDHAPAFLLAQ